MDSINRSAVTPRKTRFRTLSKVLHFRATSTIDHVEKVKLNDKLNHKEEEEQEKRKKSEMMHAFVAKMFATLSSVKTAYAELQYAQSPYDPEGVQSADRLMVTELKSLSELKQLFLKNHVDYQSPETTMLLAEIQEQRNLAKTYDVTKKILASQGRLKDSEIVFLKQKLDVAERENKVIERRLNSSGSVLHRENLHFSELTRTDFVSALGHTMKAVRSFVKLMVSEMECANWDVGLAAETIQPNVVYWDKSHVCYAFESFVCREMFDGFGHPSFAVSGDGGSRKRSATRQRVSFDNFMELKYLKAREYVTWKPKSTFAKFIWFKYLKLVHPKMESSLFGNLNQRSLVSIGRAPETAFFESFSEVAKRVWLLHCLAFSLDPTAVSIFQVKAGSCFSEVFMESVTEEAFLSPESVREVAFTVVPGFKLGKSVVQCQVYVS